MSYFETMTRGQQLELFQDFRTAYKPQKPLCSNNKSGPYKRRSKNVALNSYMFIESNPHALQSLIVLDVDHPDKFIYEEHSIAPPSYQVQNLFTHSYHAVYGLTTPVVLTDAARRPPVNLLARVETGLRRAFEADEGYTGRITRNPLSTNYQATTWGVNDDTTSHNMRTYQLKYLANQLSEAKLLPRWNDKKALKNSIVGRNVTLFDTTRQWAYSAIRNYWSDPEHIWHEVVHAYAHNKNLGAIADQWGAPLPDTEVKHLARSVSKWVHRRFTPEKFTKHQQQAQKATVSARRQKTQQLLLEAIEDMS